MFELLRLPRPGNISQVLARARDQGFVVRHRAGGSWSLTPEGREHVKAVIGSIDVAAVEVELAGQDGAELSQALHPLIPPTLAPVRWAPAISRLLERFPFDSNVFCMTRFPQDETEDGLPDPVRRVIDRSRRVLSDHGLTLHLASDRNADDELFGNVAGHMWACKYGIALFETRVRDELNDNMLIEVGSMLMTGRRCALLRDEGSPEMPTDFVGHIYKRVDFDDLDAVAAELQMWVREDLQIA
jgi:hypothetical protein